jgi:3-methylcrotonyl-CoA carboxylase alpha subunit/geranyl-CoA carboxylase alpha subunit
MPCTRYGFLSENADSPRPCSMRACSVGAAGRHPRPGQQGGGQGLALAQGVPCLPGYAGDDQRPERFAAEAARRLP